MLRVFNNSLQNNLTTTIPNNLTCGNEEVFAIIALATSLITFISEVLPFIGKDKGSCNGLFHSLYSCKYLRFN